MALKLYPEDSVQAIASAIRAKNGTSDTYKISEMASAINAIPEPSGTLSIAFNGAYDVKSYASAEVNVPEPSGTYSITSNGIYDVKSFASANVNTPTPSGTYSITDNGIYDVVNFAGVDVNVSGGGDDTRFEDLVTKQISGNITIQASGNVGSYAFIGCKKPFSVNAPNIQYISESAFQYCDNLSGAMFDNVLEIASNAFNGCVKLSQIAFPKVTTIYNSAFGNTSLYGAFLDFPEVQSIGTNCFSFCCMSAVSAPKLSYIGNSAFSACRLLVSLYLLGSSIPRLVNVNAFGTTPIGGYSESAGQYGNIYVPASLYNSYLTASNWSNFSSRFVSV